MPRVYHGGPLAGYPIGSLPENSARTPVLVHSEPSAGQFSSFPSSDVYQQLQASAAFKSGFQAGVEQARRMTEGHAYMPHSAHQQTLAQRAAKMRGILSQRRILRNNHGPIPETGNGKYEGENVEGQTSGMIRNEDG